jgi:hypothetical protein
MRTTLRVDDDVLFAVKERARRERHSVGKVLSDLARQALTNQYRAAHGSERDAFHGLVPSPTGESPLKLTDRPAPGRRGSVKRALLDINVW